MNPSRRARKRSRPSLRPVPRWLPSAMFRLEHAPQPACSRSSALHQTRADTIDPYVDLRPSDMPTHIAGKIDHTTLGRAVRGLPRSAPLNCHLGRNPTSVKQSPYWRNRRRTSPSVPPLPKNSLSCFSEVRRRENQLGNSRKSLGEQPLRHCDWTKWQSVGAWPCHDRPTIDFGSCAMASGELPRGIVPGSISSSSLMRCNVPAMNETGRMSEIR